MNLSRDKILIQFNTWLKAWNDHNLDGVMEWMHNEIVFDNWNGGFVTGKTALRKSWEPWFLHHGNFKFIKEAAFIDEEEQSMTFSWELQWPSFEKKHLGAPEKRRGIDVLILKEGKIIRKDTYSKTILEIDSIRVILQAI